MKIAMGISPNNRVEFASGDENEHRRNHVEKLFVLSIVTAVSNFSSSCAGSIRQGWAAARRCHVL